MSIVRHIAYERPVVGLPYDILFAVLLLQVEGRCKSVIAPEFLHKDVRNYLLFLFITD